MKSSTLGTRFRFGFLQSKLIKLGRKARALNLRKQLRVEYGFD